MNQNYQNSNNGGFTVNSAPGANTGNGYSSFGPPPASGVAFQMLANQETSNEENSRTSSATIHLSFGIGEIITGLFSNVGQVVTSFFSFIQLQLGVSDTTFRELGMSGGVGYAMAHTPAYVWVALVISIGAQILLQAGYLVLSHTWKKSQHDAQPTHQRYGFIQVLASKEVGYFFTGLGFLLDVAGDIGFAIAFNVPVVVCILFGLMLNGLSTWVLYDGDERVHFAYPLWYNTWKLRQIWKQAALERARLMHGVSPDGRHLTRG